MNFKSKCVGVPIYRDDVFKFLFWRYYDTETFWYWENIQLGFTGDDLKGDYDPNGKIEFNLVRNVFESSKQMWNTNFYVIYTSDNLEDLIEFKNKVKHFENTYHTTSWQKHNGKNGDKKSISEYLLNINAYNFTQGDSLLTKIAGATFNDIREISRNGVTKYAYIHPLENIGGYGIDVFPNAAEHEVYLVNGVGGILSNSLFDTPLTVVDKDLSQYGYAYDTKEYLLEVLYAWANNNQFDVDALGRICKRNTTKTLNEYSFNGNGKIFNVCDFYIPSILDTNYILNYLYVKNTNKIYAFLTTSLVIEPNRIFYKTFNKSNIPKDTGLLENETFLNLAPAGLYYDQINADNTNIIKFSANYSIDIREYYNDKTLLIVSQDKTIKYKNDETTYNIASEKILLNEISKNYVNNGLIYSNFIKNNQNTKWLVCETLEDFNRKLDGQIPIDNTAGATDIGAGTVIDNTIDIGTNDGVVTDTTKEVATTSAMYSIYNTSDNTLQSFGQYLWNSDSDMFETIVNNLKLNGSEPLDAIINCYRFQLSTDVFTDTESTIKIGRNSTNISCPKIVKYKPNHLLASFNINGLYNDFRDYQTEISIYLPFFGIISLDTSLVMYSNIKIYLTIDLFQGVGKYHIYCNDNLLTTNDVILAENVLISGTRQSQVANTYVNSITSLVTSGITMGSSIATGNAYGMLGSGTQMASATEGVLTSEGKGGFNIVSNFSPNINKYLDTNIYIVYGYYTYSIPNNYSTTVGYPYNETNTIRSVKGFVVVENSNLSIENVTSNELDLINNLLSNGVFYE